MSIVTDSLDALFSDDLTVNVLANGTYGKGLFEQPTTVALGDQVLFTDYLIYLKASAYPKLKTGDAIFIPRLYGHKSVPMGPRVTLSLGANPSKAMSTNPNFMNQPANTSQPYN